MNQAKWKCFLQTAPHSKGVSIALLILRLVIGAAFVIHGWQKIQSPGGMMGWAGPQAPIPGVLQFLAAFSEFAGGLALILGLLTRLASLGILITMTVAALMVMAAMHLPFVNPTGGVGGELPLAYWAVAFLLLLGGAGKFSLDAKIFGEHEKH
jgi:putative oxidoreductase